MHQPCHVIEMKWNYFIATVLCTTWALHLFHHPIAKCCVVQYCIKFDFVQLFTHIKHIISIVFWKEVSHVVSIFPQLTILHWLVSIQCYVFIWVLEFPCCSYVEGRRGNKAKFNIFALWMLPLERWWAAMTSFSQMKIKKLNSKLIEK